MTDFVDYIKLPNCEIKAETDKAILVYCGDIDKDPFWIPKSQVDDRSEIWKAGEIGELMVSEWIMTKRDLA